MQGIINRNRALNGDVVVVSLDSPDKWKVNHGVIQDYVEMKATEEEKNILMNTCVVNIKKESEASVQNSSPKKKFVNDNINVDSISKYYSDKDTPEVVDVSSDSDEEEDDAQKLPAAVIQNAKDPLLEVPEASASDYESEEVEDVEEKTEIEKEIEMRLKELNLNKPTIVEVDSDDSGDDVVVETTIDESDTTYETAVDTTTDTPTDTMTTECRVVR